MTAVAVEATAAEDQNPRVSMVYRLAPEGEGSVDFGSIRFDGGWIANVRAFAGERELSFRTTSGSESRLDGVVELPAEIDGPFELRLDYEVHGTAQDQPLILPFLVAGWPPHESSPQAFHAEVQLPANRFVRDSFPTEFERGVSVDRTADLQVLRFELPVVPAMIRLELSDRAPLVGVGRGLDLAALALLTVVALLGWRRLRETWT